MAIRQFELYHGIALAKVLRSEKPVTVVLIEIHPDSDDWQVYAINDADLFVKHRASGRQLARGKGGYSWQFIFSPKEVSRIGKQNEKPVYVALVCGQPVVNGNMEICFLYPEDISKIFPVATDKPFSCTVRSVPGDSLKVIVDHKIKCRPPRNAIEHWDIPGR